jgi:hypothetical protein
LTLPDTSADIFNQVKASTKVIFLSIELNDPAMKKRKPRQAVTIIIVIFRDTVAVNIN